MNKLFFWQDPFEVFAFTHPESLFTTKRSSSFWNILLIFVVIILLVSIYIYRDRIRLFFSSKPEPSQNEEKKLNTNQDKKNTLNANIPILSKKVAIPKNNIIADENTEKTIKEAENVLICV